jgi:putative copper export protein
MGWSLDVCGVLAAANYLVGFVRSDPTDSPFAALANAVLEVVSVVIFVGIGVAAFSYAPGSGLVHDVYGVLILAACTAVLTLVGVGLIDLMFELDDEESSLHA